MKRETNKKGMAGSKKWIKIFTAVILSFAFYLFLGVVISYRRQPDISQDYKSAFVAADCYSETVSCDRAYLIEDNMEALQERLRMIRQAQDRIVLSTFEFRADESGKDILAALIQAAERGVNIKILADGMAAMLRMDGNEYFYALAGMEHVEIKIYNRLNLLAPWKSMGRMHDKYLLVDDNLYVLGGRNTYDYFLGDNGYKNYDRDLLVYTTEPDSEDSSIHQLEQYFQSVWETDVCQRFGNSLGGPSEKKIAAARDELKARYETMKQTYPLMTETPDYEQMTFEVNKITLLSNPVHVYAKEPTVFYCLSELMRQAEGEILIHTPYIICNDWMYQSFREICQRNPDTSLMTNSAANNGNPFGASDYLLHRQELLDTGLTIYEYEGGVSYHGKSMVIGDRMSVIGSFNMDMRSAYVNTELMLAVDSREVAGQLRAHMKAYEEDAVKALGGDSYEIPEGVTRQSIDGKMNVIIKTLNLFNWFRFLM